MSTGTNLELKPAASRPRTATRLTAGERRDEVIAAAAIEFATGGYAGTSTEAIAQRAGVSQPYLFQLFHTKKALFLAAVQDCFERTGRRFEEAAEAATPDNPNVKQMLQAMGHAYIRMLLADRNLLRLQLNAYAACSDPEIRVVVRRGFAGLWRQVASLSGADPDAINSWFAEGMLINVIASIDDARTEDEFKALMCGGVGAME